MSVARKRCPSFNRMLSSVPTSRRSAKLRQTSGDACAAAICGTAMTMMSAALNRSFVVGIVDHLSEIHSDSGAPRHCSHSVRGPRRAHVRADEHALGYVALEPRAHEWPPGISHSGLRLRGNRDWPAISDHDGDRERRLDVFALAHQFYACADKRVHPGVLEELRVQAGRRGRDAELVVALHE